METWVGGSLSHVTLRHINTIFNSVSKIHLMGFVEYFFFNNTHDDFISKEQVLQIPLSHLLITYYDEIKAKETHQWWFCPLWIHPCFVQHCTAHVRATFVESSLCVSPRPSVVVALIFFYVVHQPCFPGSRAKLRCLTKCWDSLGPEQASWHREPAAKGRTYQIGTQFQICPLL